MAKLRKQTHFYDERVQGKNKKIKMLLAGLGSVRIGKNCDLGLENAALGLRPRAAFSRPQSQFFPMRTSQPANNIYLVQSLKLPHECGPCTIRNSSAAIKRWLLVKPELLWSYSWCTSIDWVERCTKYVLHRKKLYLYLCLVDILVDLQRTVTRVLNRYTRAKYLETVWSTFNLTWHICYYMVSYRTTCAVLIR